MSYSQILVFILEILVFKIRQLAIPILVTSSARDALSPALVLTAGTTAL
jgi:hypothetical protein